MKIVFIIQNYDSNQLYVNTDTKQIATAKDRHEDGFWTSKASDFIYGDVMKNDDYVEVLMQRKTEFYKLVDAFIADGYEDLSYNYVLANEKEEEGAIELE